MKDSKEEGSLSVRPQGKIKLVWISQAENVALVRRHARISGAHTETCIRGYGLSEVCQRLSPCEA